MTMQIYQGEAKAILLFLTSQEELVENILPSFEAILGSVEFRSPWHPFSHTPYYEEELGPNLKRSLVGFKNIFNAAQLTELKQMARRLEKESTDKGERRINIDPGYVDLYKFVLGSGKGSGLKIKISNDVFAHTQLRFEKEKWVPFEWSYTDFKEKTYHATLSDIRNSLRKELTDSRSDKSAC